jgi:cytochrome c oxidase assembly protein subunit 15
MAPASGRLAHRLASLTAVATLVLVVAGGLVTNTGAALAVPDWPTTFGHNMFLYPWSGMVGGVFYEHGHRLLGSLVGLLTLALAVALWLTEPRGWVRRLGLVAVGLVAVQGLVGGLRVILLQDTLAIVHGCLAQAFFALVVALTAFTGRGWGLPAAALPEGESRTLGWLAGGASAALYGQIVLGALATHAGWVNLHLAGAVVAVAAGAAAALRVLARPADRPGLVGPARALGVLLVVQVALGLGAYLARFTGLAVPGGAFSVLALPVAHRVTASLLLGAAVVLALQVWRQRRPAGVAAPAAGGIVPRRLPA